MFGVSLGTGEFWGECLLPRGVLGGLAGEILGLEDSAVFIRKLESTSSSIHLLHLSL